MRKDLGWKYQYFFKGFAKNEFLSCPACGSGLEYNNSVNDGFREWYECNHCYIRFYDDDELEITLTDVLLEAYLDAHQRIIELEMAISTSQSAPGSSIPLEGGNDEISKG